MFRITQKGSDIVTPLQPYHSNLFSPPIIKQVECAGTIIDKSNFTDNLREMVRSACRKGGRRCLCNALTPLLRSFQLFGIFPVTYDGSNCQVSHSWTSIFSLINGTWFWGNVSLYIYIYAFVGSFVSLFKGTDFYTISLVLITQFMTTEMIFFFGNFCGNSFCKAWELLHRAVKELYIMDFNCVWRLTYFIPAYIFGESAVMMMPMLFEQDPMLKVPPGVVIASFIGNVIPNFVTASFSVLLWIIGYYFSRVTERIKAIFQNSEQESPHMEKARGHQPSSAEELARLRRIHEDLCDCARYFANAFGPQLLFIFATTLFRFIAGIYSISVTITGLAPKRLAAFTVNSFLHGTLALGRIMLVLKSSEFVIQKSEKSSEILIRNLGPQTREELRNEVSAFLDKIGKFPLEITCCGIHKLDPSYLASAIPSIITYVLVLMQFRQGDHEASSFESLTSTS